VTAVSDVVLVRGLDVMLRVGTKAYLPTASGLSDAVFEAGYLATTRCPK
jgi:hypothetical protein